LRVESVSVKVGSNMASGKKDVLFLNDIDIVIKLAEERFCVCAGDLLIIMAQIVVAVQMVYEEKFVTRYNVPAMQAVGWEGQ
jgi:hypothetical protein